MDESPTHPGCAIFPTPPSFTEIGAMCSRQLLLLLLLLPAWAAAAAGSEPGDPNQHAAPGPSGHLCEAGHYLTEDCYMGQARGCCPCPPGTFMSQPNREVSCLLCTPCRKDQEMVRDCTPTRDRQCQCKPGEYYCDSEYCSERCFPCTSCPGAALQACTATRDTVCAPGAPAQPGPAVGSLTVVIVASVVSVVSVVVLVIIAIAQWCRGGVPRPQWMCRFAKPASVEPGSHGHVPESSEPFVSSPETRGADAPVPTMGARLLPTDRLDVTSELLILPWPPECPAGVDGPCPEAEAGDEAGPHAGHHGPTLHPPHLWSEVDLVGAEEPRAAAEEPGRPEKPPSCLRDQTQTTAPESGPPGPDTETTPKLQEEADTPPPAARGPDPPGTLSRPWGRNGAAGGGGGRRPGSPRDGSPTSCCRPPRSPGLEAPAGLRPPEQVPESSEPFVSSPETRGADAPVPTGARRLPKDRLDVASELLILPWPSESPTGVDSPCPEAEAGDEARPHAGHHGLTLLHPPHPRPKAHG